MRRFALFALLCVTCAPKFPDHPPPPRDLSKEPPAIRLWSFYPPIPAHDPATGEPTGKYVPAHGVVERTRPLVAVMAHGRWRGQPFSVPVTFDQAPWGTFTFPIEDSDRGQKITLSFEANGGALPWSIAGHRVTQMEKTTEMAPDRQGPGPPPPPPAPSRFYDDEMVYEARDTPPLLPRDVAPTSVTLYRIADGGSEYHGYRVLGSQALDAAAARHVVDIIDDPETYSAAAFGCYDPHHAVRIVISGRIYDYVICLHCRYLHFTDGDGTRPLSLAGAARLERVINAVFGRSG